MRPTLEKYGFWFNTKFEYHNPHPMGKLPKKNCVKRAISIITNQDYMKVQRQIYRMVKRAQEAHPDKGIKAFNNIHVVDEYAKWKGWEKIQIETGCEDQVLPDVGHLGYKFNKGKMLLFTPGHITAVIDGVVHDVLDCRWQPARAVYIVQAEGFTADDVRKEFCDD